MFLNILNMRAEQNTKVGYGIYLTTFFLAKKRQTTATGFISNGSQEKAYVDYNIISYLYFVGSLLVMQVSIISLNDCVAKSYVSTI